MNMFDSLKSPFFATKLVELVLSIICALLIFDVLPSDKVVLIELTHAAIYGSILVNLIVIVAFIYEEPLSGRLNVIINAVATILFVIASVIMFSSYFSQELRRVLAAALIALLNAIVYGADCYFTLKYAPE